MRQWQAPASHKQSTSSQKGCHLRVETRPLLSPHLLFDAHRSPSPCRVCLRSCQTPRYVLLRQHYLTMGDAVSPWLGHAVTPHPEDSGQAPARSAERSFQGAVALAPGTSAAGDAGRPRGGSGGGGRAGCYKAPPSQAVEMTERRCGGGSGGGCGSGGGGGQQAEVGNGAKKEGKRHKKDAQQPRRPAAAVGLLEGQVGGGGQRGRCRQQRLLSDPFQTLA
jgi:hypothetical protein